MRDLDTTDREAYLVGAGLASLAAAVYLLQALPLHGNGKLVMRQKEPEPSRQATSLKATLKIQYFAPKDGLSSGSVLRRS